MSVSTTRLLSPEEIAVAAGRDFPRLHLPDPKLVFADRALRLRQLAADHPMRDYMMFLAVLNEAQHDITQSLQHAPIDVPSLAALEEAAQLGEAPLSPTMFARDPAWREQLRSLLRDVLKRLPADSPARAGVQAVHDLSDDALERQASLLLGGISVGLDFAAAPLIAAGLQVLWTRLVVATAASVPAEKGGAFGYASDATRCPCCGTLPTASITRIGGEAAGHRYLHCALCSTQWHMVRVKCTHCESTKGISYQSLEPVEGLPVNAQGKVPSVQLETCDECGHYLKIVHMTSDPHVEPVADDVATLTLDLLATQELDLQRHGVNLLMLFGDPEAETADADSAVHPPPDPRIS